MGIIRWEGDFLKVAWPKWDEQYLAASEITVPVAINGKTRVQINFPADTDPKSMEAAVLSNEQVLKWLDGNTPKKVIVIPGRMVNIVIWLPEDAEVKAFASDLEILGI